MSSHSELPFLSGDNPATGPDFWLDKFVDMNKVFNAVYPLILLTVAVFMMILGANIVPISLKLVSLVLTAISAVVTLVLAAIVAAGSLLKRLLLATGGDQVLMPIVACRAVRFVSAVFDWYLPANSPETALIRISGTYIGGMTAYVLIFRPLSEWFGGVADIIYGGKPGLSSYCMGVRQGWFSSHTSHCPGEETGLWLRMTFEDIWESMPRLVDLDGEIPHLQILAIASVFASVALFILVAMYFDDVSKADAAAASSEGESRAEQPSGPAGPRAARPLASWQQDEGVVSLFTLVRRYEDFLAEKDRLLSVANEKIQAAEQRMEEGWAKFKELTAVHEKCSEAIARAQESPLLTALQRKLSEVESTARTRESTIITLQRRLAEQEASFTGLQSKARRMGDDAAKKVRALSDQVDQLQRQLEAVGPEGIPMTEVESLRVELESRNDQLAASERRLAAAEAREREFRGRNDEIDAERRRLADRVNELEAQGKERQQLANRVAELEAQQDQQLTNWVAELDNQVPEHQQLPDWVTGLDNQVQDQQLANRVAELEAQVQELTAQNGLLQSTCDNMAQACGSVATIQQERDAAVGQVQALESVLQSTRVTAETAYRESQDALAQSRAVEEDLRQKLETLEIFSGDALADERASAAAAQTELARLQVEVDNLQTFRDLAFGDAERAVKRAQDSEKRAVYFQERAVHFEKRAGSLEMTVGTLETRLSRHENVSSLQEIPKRQIGNMGSIATALAQSQVKVVEQHNRISDLERQVAALKQNAPGPGNAAAAAVADEARKLRAALEQARRDRTEDQIRLTKRTKELEEENKKLRVSLSNAEAKPESGLAFRRSGGSGRRPAGLP